MMDSGFIYILTNKAFNKWIKIGKTTKHPLERAAQLYSSGVPLPFEIAFALWTHAVDEVELNIHARLEACRVTASREFFDLQVSDAVRIVIEESVRCFWGLNVVECDSYVPEDAVTRYARIARLHPFDMTIALSEMLSDDAVLESAKKYRETFPDRFKDPQQSEIESINGIDEEAAW